MRIDFRPMRFRFRVNSWRLPILLNSLELTEISHGLNRLTKWMGKLLASLKMTPSAATPGPESQRDKYDKN